MRSRAATVASFLALVAACSSSSGGAGGSAKKYCYLLQSDNGSQCICFNTDHSAGYSGNYVAVDDCDVAAVGGGGACCATLDASGQTTTCECKSTYCQETAAGVCECSYFGVALDVPSSPGVTACSASDCAFTSDTQHVCICGSSTYGSGHPVTGSPTACSPQTQFADICGAADTQLTSCASVSFKHPGSSSGGSGSSSGSSCVASGGYCSSSLDCCGGSTCQSDGTCQ